MILYNDRVNAWNRGRDIDAVIDLQPTADNIKALLDDAWLNRQAQAELVSYNKDGKFLLEHPLLLNRKATNKFIEMRRNDPDLFLKELHNANQSISRYQSMISKNKYKDQEELVRWQKLIEGYENKLLQMKAAMSLG